MMAARLVCQMPQAFVRYVPKTVILLKPSAKPQYVRLQRFADDTRSGFRRGSRSKSLKEIVMGPATDTAFTVGKVSLAGASAFGLGALCYYGLGLSNEVGAIDRAVLWPKYVRDRITTTYMYFGSSIALTAAAAVAASRSPVVMNLVMKRSWLALGATMAVMIGSGIVVQSMPYTEGLGMKQLAWMAHSGILGAVIAPMCLLGGPLLVRAAWYTAGIVGGLSMVAACAPSDKFLSMGGPLAIGLGVVFASSIGSMFLSPATALGAGLYSMSLYGGLIIFSGFLLYDTQRIVKTAEHYPMYAARPYDPINASISIYLDTINIFVRIVQILAGGGAGRRK